VVVRLAWPTVACTRCTGAPRSSAWLTWAWPEPVRRHRARQPGALGRDLDDAVHLARIERAAALARAEHRGVRVGGAQRRQVLPDRGLQQHRPGLAPFAEHAHLASVVAGGKVAPPESAGFADAQAAEIEQPEQRLVSGVAFEGEHAQHVVDAEDTLGERALDLGQADGGTDVDGEVAGLVPEGEQRLHRAESARLGRGRQGFQSVLERLHVAQRHRAQRALRMGEERRQVGGVGALRGGAAAVQPEPTRCSSLRACAGMTAVGRGRGGGRSVAMVESGSAMPRSYIPCVRRVQCKISALLLH